MIRYRASIPSHCVHRSVPTLSSLCLVSEWLSLYSLCFSLTIYLSLHTLVPLSFFRRSRPSQPGELQPAAAAAAEFRDDDEQGGDRVSSSVG